MFNLGQNTGAKVTLFLWLTQIFYKKKCTFSLALCAKRKKCASFLERPYLTLLAYSKLLSRAIYLPRMSNSIFTTVPTSMSQKLVFSLV